VIDILLNRLKTNQTKPTKRSGYQKKSNPSRFDLNKSDLESVNANIHGFQPGPSR
jgi:hypothetical protein